MKVMHIASFGGNIGDILNHYGFYKTIGTRIGIDYSEKVEVRRFYKNASPNEKLTFSSKFLREVNEYDVLIIGGGGFFDARWPYSHTGTTIDFSDDFISGIKIPVIVNAMGYHEFYSQTDQEVQKLFGQFVRKVIDKGWFLSLRNDGSFARFRRRYGSLGENKILCVPDNGFFALDKAVVQAAAIRRREKVIGLCITNDLFCSEYNGNLTADSFNEKIVNVIATLSEQNQIVLFAHTPDDIVTIGYLFQKLSSSCKRYNIVVAPFNPNGETPFIELAQYYQACDCIIGMRFHSLILALQLHKPTIALSGHAQIEDFFQDLGLSDYCVCLNNTDFDKKLIRLLNMALDYRTVLSTMIRDIHDSLCKKNSEYAERIAEYLTTFNIKK